MATMFYYHNQEGKVVARSYKHFFDVGSCSEYKDAVTNLHKFAVSKHCRIDSPQDLMFEIQFLTEEYGPVTVSEYEYRG